MTDEEKSNDVSAELAGSVNDFKHFVDSALVGMYRTNLKGKILYANDTLWKMFGFDSFEEFSKQNVMCRYKNEARRAELIEIVKKDGRVLDFEADVLTKDGKEKTILLSAVSQGDTLCGMIRDITRRNKAEQDLRDANMRLSDALMKLKQTQQQIIQHERLSALGQMASGIAHDFNNALMPILGYSEFLLASPGMLDDKEETGRMLLDMHSAAKDATQIIRRLRDFYKPQDDDFDSLDVNILIETAVALTQPRWREELGAKGITINVEKKLANVAPIRGKETELRETLVNLILNSVDAMPEGGTLTISSVEEKEWIVVTVSDTGIGMSEDVRQRCFEPFFSTKGEFGTGMGLALSYGTIRRHGGTINVRSKVGEGAAVTFRLPIEQKPDGKEADAVDDIPFVEPLNVLIVDDDLWSSNLLTRYLVTQNHKVETAETGSTGLENFRGGNYDLVITDRAMPDMSGDEVASTIHGLNPETLIIMATGFGEIMRDTGERPPGVDAILSKPVTQRDLRQAIGEVVTKKAREKGSAKT